MTINPKFVCEYLRAIYEEKKREFWGEHIYRTIVETKYFSQPSEENVGEIHRRIAAQRRQQSQQQGHSAAPLSQQQAPNSFSTLESFKIMDLTGHVGVGSSSTGKALIEEIKKADGNHLKVI